MRHQVLLSASIDQQHTTPMTRRDAAASNERHPRSRIFHKDFLRYQHFCPEQRAIASADAATPSPVDALLRHVVMSGAIVASRRSTPTPFVWSP